MADQTQRKLPRPTPETQHYWDGTRVEELRLQKCNDCRETYFPPRPFCPHCSSRDVSVFTASGKATLHSYVISHIPAPGLEPPYSVAVVALEEGPRLMTNLVGCDQTPEVLKLDMSLEVTFEAQNDEITLPFFKPAT